MERTVPRACVRGVNYVGSEQRGPAAMLATAGGGEHKMPGGRLEPYRLGDRAELLVQQLLAGFAFTTPVPRPEDVGIDFFCTLIAGRDGAKLLRAGLSFGVQAKSNRKPVIYRKPHEVAWIEHQENPILLCVADRKKAAMDVYSTWNLLCGVQSGWKGQKAESITLRPGHTGPWPGVSDKPKRCQDILLGKPIVRISHDDIFDDARSSKINQVITAWVAIDRMNIVNRYAGLNWALGPLTYETGELPQPGALAFYWNAKNLPQCVLNLGRSATAVFRIVRDRPSSTPAGWKAVQPSVRELLRWCQKFDSSLSDFLNDLDTES